MRIEWSEPAVLDLEGIIYKLTHESILILGIIHAARDLNNMKPQPWEDS